MKEYIAEKYGAKYAIGTKTQLETEAKDKDVTLYTYDTETKETKKVTTAERKKIVKGEADTDEKKTTKEKA